MTMTTSQRVFFLIGSGTIISGIVFLVTQNSTSNAFRYEQTTQTLLAPDNGCVTLDICPALLQNGAFGSYWAGVMFDCDNIPDANANPCDGGGCSEWVEGKVPFDMHGGAICVAGGGSCVTDGGALSWYTAATTVGDPDAAAYGTSMAIDFAANGAISLQACAGANSPCWARAVISAVISPTPDGG